MLGVHTLAVLAVVATVLLGLWQLHAWQTRRADAESTLTHVPPRALARVMTSDAPFPGLSVGRPVTFRGRWLSQDSLVISDRLLHGRRGVWAVTPVAVCSRGTACADAPAMLVVRGWAPTRADLPRPPRGPVAVTGWLQPGEGSTDLDLHPRDRVLPALRIPDALQHVDQDLYGAYVVARETGPAPAVGSTAGWVPGAADGMVGLARVTPGSLPAVSSFTALRNLLYALEWWAFGGFAVFVWWRTCRDELAADGETGSGGDRETLSPGVASQT